MHRLNKRGNKVVGSPGEAAGAVPVMELTTERRMVGGLISSFRMLDSVASGKPLSSISSRSSYTITTLSLMAVSEHSPK